MVYTTHKDGDEWGMVYCCYTCIHLKLADHWGYPIFQETSMVM